MQHCPSKPYLFLDFDGVVSPYNKDKTNFTLSYPPNFWTYPGAPWKVHFHPDIKEFLQRLDAVFTVVWLTSWEDTVLPVAEKLGVAHWPVLPLSWSSDHWDPKSAAMVRFLDGKNVEAVAWVDDMMSASDAAKVAATAGVRVVNLRPVATAGLKPKHIKELENLAATLAALNDGCCDVCDQL